MFVCDDPKGGAVLPAAVAMLLFMTQDTQLVILFLAGIFGNAIGAIPQGPGGPALLPFCAIGFTCTAAMLILNPGTKEI